MRQVDGPGRRQRIVQSKWRNRDEQIDHRLYCNRGLDPWWLRLSTEIRRVAAKERRTGEAVPGTEPGHDPGTWYQGCAYLAHAERDQGLDQQRVAVCLGRLGDVGQ